MSNVTNILISFSVIEDTTKDELEGYLVIREINRWLKEHEHPPLCCLSCHCRGGKAMEAAVYGQAFNYLELEAFCDFVLTREWRWLEMVQMFIQEQEEDRFRMLDFNG